MTCFREMDGAGASHGGVLLGGHALVKGLHACVYMSLWQNVLEHAHTCAYGRGVSRMRTHVLMEEGLHACVSLCFWKRGFTHAYTLLMEPRSHSGVGCLFVCLLAFQVSVALCRPGCPGTYSVAQAGLGITKTCHHAQLFRMGSGD